MQSPIFGLCEVLKEVKRIAKEHPPKNETHTRTSLINPLLAALGWDFGNSKHVELEKRVVSRNDHDIVDYYLTGESPIIVEAKKLGEDLESHYRQILFYADGTNAKSLFLTDGIKWWHYTNHSANPDDTTSSMKLSKPYKIDLAKIKDHELPATAAYFVTHLDAALFLNTVNDDKVEDDLYTKVANLERTIRDIEARFERENDESSVSKVAVLLAE